MICKVCEETKSDYIHFMDNVEEIRRLNLSSSTQYFERHCPEDGNGLDCLITVPKGYQRPIPWPDSEAKELKCVELGDEPT